MSKNYMKEVAQLLSVEFGDKFEIENMKYNPHYINKNGLYDCEDDCRNGYFGVLLTGEKEIKKTILTEKEREYLASVIAPKSIYENVDYIVKNRADERFYITIIYNRGLRAHLPCFTDGNMYNGMEVGELYTLKKLGLSRDERK